MVGWTDLPADLSDTAQIARLRGYLPHAAILISSDLTRAVATADALGPGHRRLPHDPDLREIHFGAWEMRRFDEIDAEDPDRLRAFWDEPGLVTPPGGEAWDTICDRVNGAVDRLLFKYPGSEIIIVAHFGAILTQIQRAERLTPVEAFGHRIEPLSVTRLTIEKSWRTEVINHQP